MVTDAQLALAATLVGLWCVGWVTTGFILAILNRKDFFMFSKLSTVKKAIATAIGMFLAVLVFANQHFGDFIPATWRIGLGTLIAILTPIATYLVKNQPAP